MTRVIAMLLLLAVTACARQEEATAPDTDPGIGHVHGVGVDPADGAVYVAAHYGLFRLAGADTAERVAGRVQDHMGFTVVGPKTFLASGHPGEAAPAVSPHLGLIRTADAGRTWKAVSETGTADFHALQPAGANLYAFDSQTGRVRVSADSGVTWMLGAEEGVIDLAATAAQPDRVYATTQSGLKVSANRGLDFEPVKTAPKLTHVDVPAKKTLIGTDAGGQIQTSTDGGGTWRAGGSLPGMATAFTALDTRRLLAATEDGTVHESRDGGATFTVLFRPAGS